MRVLHRARCDWAYFPAAFDALATNRRISQFKSMTFDSIGMAYWLSVLSFSAKGSALARVLSIATDDITWNLYLVNVWLHAHNSNSVVIVYDILRQILGFFFVLFFDSL